jgi:nicotinamide-nucleotide amidase
MASLDYGIIKKVHEALLEKGLRVSLAESCTSGLVAHALTLMPGARGSFDSSMVCYSRHAKQKLLGLSEEFLNEHGTVSEETARAMAEAARKKAGTDVGLAVTGILGPETIEDREVGLVYIAISTEKETLSKRCRFKGERDEVKHDAANTALQFLYDSVLS